MQTKKVSAADIICMAVKILDVFCLHELFIKTKIFNKMYAQKQREILHPHV